MKNNEIAAELIKALTNAENKFGLSEILQRQGILKDEIVTIEFKLGNETLLTCQRSFNSLSTQCCWDRAHKKTIGSDDKKQSIESIRQDTSEVLSEKNIGQDIAEILSEAGMLNTFKNALLKRDVTISETQPVIVQFSFNNGFAVTLKCPCSPKPCCQIAD